MAAHKDKAAELRHAIDTARIGHLRKLKQEELDAHIERMRDVANHWCARRREKSVAPGQFRPGSCAWGIAHRASKDIFKTLRDAFRSK